MTASRTYPDLGVCRRCGNDELWRNIAGLCSSCDGALTWPAPGAGWSGGACRCGAITTLYDGLCRACRETVPVLETNT